MSMYAPFPPGARWTADGNKPLSDRDFEVVKSIIRRESAISLENHERHYLRSRLAALAEARNETLPELMTQIRRGSSDVRTSIVEAVTIQESLFFRNTRAFALLRRRLLPRLIEARRNRRTLTIWSAGCATGQEPYSVAIATLEHEPQLTGWSIRILATDISEHALRRARAGIYTPFEVSRGLPGPLLEKYFEPVGLRWQVVPSVRCLVEFRRQNVLHAWDGPKPDLVLMRNVLIYFDRETKGQVLERIRRSIASDALLLLGTAETTWGVSNRWEPVNEDGTMYFRPTPSPSPEPSTQ